jgi:hypothetical protein
MFPGPEELSPLTGSQEPQAKAERNLEKKHVNFSGTVDPHKELDPKETTNSLRSNSSFKNDDSLTFFFRRQASLRFMNSTVD